MGKGKVNAMSNARAKINGAIFGMVYGIEAQWIRMVIGRGLYLWMRNRLSNFFFAIPHECSSTFHTCVCDCVCFSSHFYILNNVPWKNHSLLLRFVIIIIVVVCSLRSYFIVDCLLVFCEFSVRNHRKKVYSIIFIKGTIQHTANKTKIMNICTAVRKSSPRTKKTNNSKRRKSH